MKRALFTPAVLALALTLTACGGSDADPTLAGPTETPTASSTPSTPSAEPSAVPSTCPITATEVTPPANAIKDLATKPVPAAGEKPAPEGPTGLTYADIVVGSGDEVKVGSDAELKYVGVLYDSGTEFDSSWSRGDAETFALKACFEGAIPGFSVGPIGMKVGGRRQINIPAVLGYGESGQGEDIPPNSALIFVVDLVSVTGP